MCGCCVCVFLLPRQTRRVSITTLPQGEDLRRIREDVLLLRRMFDSIHATWVVAHQSQVPQTDLRRRSELLQALFTQCVAAVAAETMSPANAIRESLTRFRQVLRTQRRYGFLCTCLTLASTAPGLTIVSVLT